MEGWGHGGPRFQLPTPHLYSAITNPHELLAGNPQSHHLPQLITSKQSTRIAFSSKVTLFLGTTEKWETKQKPKPCALESDIIIQVLYKQEEGALVLGQSQDRPQSRLPSLTFLRPVVATGHCQAPPSACLTPATPGHCQPAAPSCLLPKPGTPSPCHHGLSC